MRKKLSILILIVSVGLGGYYGYQYKKRVPSQDVDIQFVMEAYDKIQENYWNGLGASSTARALTLAKVSEALSQATSTDGRKELALSMVASTLAGLEPAGRNGIMSEKQVTSLRNEVANVDPASGEVQPTVSSQVLSRTLYLKVSRMSPTTLAEFATAVDQASSTPSLESLILDLRGNIGGALDFLPGFLGLFIGPDQYAFDLYAQGKKDVIRTTQGEFHELSRFKEMAVLTDGATQSTAELTADALKRYRIAKTVGERTKGWGTIENTYPLETVIDPNERYTLFLVNHLTVRRDNQPIEGHGVTPDVDATKPGWQKALTKEFSSPSLIAALEKVVSAR